jgi:hypothetical protein
VTKRCDGEKGWTAEEVKTRVTERAAAYVRESRDAKPDLSETVRMDLAHQAALCFENTHTLQAKRLMNTISADEARTIPSYLGHYKRIMGDLGLIPGTGKAATKAGFAHEL